jgi:hypothetical protein
VFVGGRDPSPASIGPNAVVFGPGVHHLPGVGGVMQLPPTADTIVLQRGAWVEGRVNITRASPTSSGGPVRVIGHGLFEGSRYTYHGSTVADNLRFVEAQWDRPLLWEGPTLVHPQGHVW